MISPKIQKTIFVISSILMLGGAFSYFFQVEYAVYIFGVGVIGTLFIRLKNLPKTNDFRIKRLQKIQAFSAILLIGTVYLMFTKNDAWIITLLLSASVDLIISFRMPTENKK